MPAYHRASGDASVTPRNPPCPRCSGPLVRVRRHAVDRIVSLFAPVRRYRCDSLACRWEGTLRARGSDPAETAARRPSEP